MQTEDKALRKLAQNAVAISVLALQERRHQRLMGIICSVCAPLGEYHTLQNKTLRSTQDSATFSVEAVSGSYLEHLKDFVRLLSDGKALREAGFHIAAFDSAGGAAKGLGLECDIEHEIVSENEYASVFGHCVLSLLVARANRGQWMQSWPARMVRCLGDRQAGEQAVRQFMSDFQIFEDLKRLDIANKEVADVVRRHVMGYTSNFQLRTGIGQVGLSNVAGGEKFLSLLRSRANCVQCTQLVEDMNGVQSISSLKPCRRYRKPATAMATVLAQDLPASRHRYVSIESSLPAPWKAACLPKSAWGPIPADASMNFA